MSGSIIATLIALLIQLVLGALVFHANPNRKSNQSFLLLTCAAVGWLGSLYYVFTATDAEAAEHGIRQASAAAVLILLTLNLLRISIREWQKNWRFILRRCRTWMVLSGALIIFCQTDIFLRGAQLSESTGSGVHTPIYGPGVNIYLICFLVGIATLVITTWRDLHRTVGGPRTELGFILIGGIGVLLPSLPLALAMGAFFDPSRLLWLAPFRVVIFNIVVAYGIATRKIMEVGVLLRKATSYVLLTAYVLTLYALVWWLVQTVLKSAFPTQALSVAHVAAAIVIAFAMAPARGLSQQLAERLFISTGGLDFRATVSKAASILESVTTLGDLLQRFAQTIAAAVKTDRVIILLPEKGRFKQAYAVLPAEANPEIGVSLDDRDPLIEYTRQHHGPVVLDELRRIRTSPELEEVITRMQTLGIALASGAFTREHLTAVMLLGPRTTGRIYGSSAQSALQVLCGQLAVAIENAQLFTEVQNAKIYNETLLEHLTTGVIAAGVDERITVFNQEAGQITEMNSREMLDLSLPNLPNPIRDMFRNTLRSGEPQSGEILLQTGDATVVARASSSTFHGQSGQMLGALMVLTDITALKRLELQIRRSDRLASLGTLSAGMAHEIKNPLVSIKTFAQLLPERYQDSDFRDTFSNLIGHEIDRIDSLVNQLLRFARPAKPHLKPMHVHDVLEKSLLLISHRLYQKDIKLTRCWETNVDTIHADADQLEQVFLNFFLNAMEAMKQGGELNVMTRIRTDNEWISAITQTNGDSDTHEVLQITIRDTGEGIRSEDIPHVFDPFFTTKDYGTGLGLSVVHGIIQEHGGQIEVESELAKGTAFHILLPVVRFDREVAAA